MVKRRKKRTTGLEDLGTIISGVTKVGVGAVVGTRVISSIPVAGAGGFATQALGGIVRLTPVVGTIGALGAVTKTLGELEPKKKKNKLLF